MDPHWPHRSGAGDTGGQGGDPVVPNTVAFGPVPSRGASGYPAGGGADAQGQRRGMPGQFAGFDSSASGPAASPGMPSAFMGSRAGLGLSHGGAAPRGAPLTAAESASQQLVGDVKRVDIAGVSYKEILGALRSLAGSQAILRVCSITPLTFLHHPLFLAV